VVISKGGYGSIPVAVAAVVYRIPFLLHESDAISGLANRMLASWSSVITVGFAATRGTVAGQGEKTIVTGTPVRTSLLAIDNVRAKQAFNFSSERPVLLITGGSQGAQQINDILVASLSELLSIANIIHLTGADHLERVMASAREALGTADLPDSYKPFGYLTEQMAAALAAADAVVTRAGATALAELALLKKAIIIVPLDAAAQDHQRRNAEVFVAAGAARVIDPANLGRSIFIQNVRDLVENRTIRETLENNIGQLARPQAGRDIALLAIKLAQGLVPRHPKGTAAPAR
jgi:UDP-N-acetylglucosamine--N-acetylmuramyl-(pentapeptide) pyrophosphoryl-undecaprenol N-acetylglucosamine transferase